jgi:hypothetical protein
MQGSEVQTTLAAHGVIAVVVLGRASSTACKDKTNLVTEGLSHVSVSHFSLIHHANTKTSRHERIDFSRHRQNTMDITFLDCLLYP